MEYGNVDIYPAKKPEPSNPAGEFVSMMNFWMMMHERSLKDDPKAEGKDVRMLYLGTSGVAVVKSIWPEHNQFVGILYINEGGNTSRIFTHVTQCTIEFEVFAPENEEIAERPVIGFSAENQKIPVT